MHDIVIRNGQVVDGTRRAAFPADVAIDGGVITAIEPRITEGAGRTIDADGAIVTPGFVDIHTHYDGQVTWDDLLDPSASHGTTTVITGNCGVGFAPVRPGEQHSLIELMEGVEDIPGTALYEGIDWAWESFPDYLDCLRDQAVVDGRRRPSRPRTDAGLRDGRARDPQRGRHCRRHRGDGVADTRCDGGRRHGPVDVADHGPPVGPRRSGARNVRRR